MPDSFYPSVDFDFIKEKLLETGKIEGHFTVGNTVTFISSGNKAIHKRSIMIRLLYENQVCYEQATGLSARFGFIGALLQWYIKNRNWKEGGYIS